MATYKVPQDVEADDKLLGPFSFRQFAYLMVTFGCLALAVALFQIFPLLAVLPVFPAGFFLILALPVKKDQPMETYLASVISFHLKPKARRWMPGQMGNQIQIDVAKSVEAPRARNISEEEASRRLSFLADVVDTEGRSIKETKTALQDDFFTEAYNTVDMFDNYERSSNNIGRLIDRENEERRAAMVNQMRVAIANSAYNTDRTLGANQPVRANPNERTIQPRNNTMISSAVVTPTVPEGSNN